MAEPSPRAIVMALLFMMIGVSSVEERQITIEDTTANPAPLGLLAFGMTTVLLNLHNAGFFALGAMVMAMGAFYGGVSQIIAGIMEFKKGNTFGTTAFTSYGFFWLTLVAIWLLPSIHSGGEPVTPRPEGNAMFAYLMMWGIFSTAFFIGTFRMSRALQFVFGTLVVLFFLLAAATKLDSQVLHTIAGYEGIVCGASAIYTAIAQILNEVYGRTLLPLGDNSRKQPAVKQSKTGSVLADPQTA